MTAKTTQAKPAKTSATPAPKAPARASAVRDTCEIDYVDELRVQRARQGVPDADAVATLAETFKMLGDPTRLRIVAALAALLTLARGLVLAGLLGGGGGAGGVEDLSALDRYVLGIEAGLDQFGGEEDPAPLLEAVATGRISEARIDDSALRILIQRFELGLFENPFVDEAEAARLVGCADFTAEAEAAQRRALTWLSGDLAPLTASDRIFVHGFDPAALKVRGLAVTDDLETATVGLVRMTAPWQTLHPTYFFGRMQHEGDLDFKPGDPDFERLREIAAKVPVVVSVHLDRPAILTPLKDMARLLIAEFGASEAAVLDAVTGLARPEGHLPFSLPASMEAVLAQSPDVPMDDPAPLFPIRHGL